MRSIKWLMHPQRSDNCIVFDNQQFKKQQIIYSRTHNSMYVDGVIDHFRVLDGGPPPPAWLHNFAKQSESPSSKARVKGDTRSAQKDSPQLAPASTKTQPSSERPRAAA